MCSALAPIARGFQPSQYREEGKHPTSDFLASLRALLMDNARTISFESFSSFSCWAYDVSKARKTKHLVRRAQQRLQAVCSRGRVKIDLDRGLHCHTSEKVNQSRSPSWQEVTHWVRRIYMLLNSFSPPPLLLLYFISSAKFEIYFRDAVGHFIACKRKKDKLQKRTGRWLWEIQVRLYLKTPVFSAEKIIIKHRPITKKNAIAGKCKAMRHKCPSRL